MPVYILPGSTLKQETIENLFNTFRTTSAIDGVPPVSLAFHTVPAATHQCSSPAQIADYHAQNKQEGVSLEPVIVLDGQSEGDGTALIVGFPREDEDEEPAPTNTEAQAQSYPSIRVVSAVSVSCYLVLLLQFVNFCVVDEPFGRQSFDRTSRSGFGKCLVSLE